MSPEDVNPSERTPAVSNTPSPADVAGLSTEQLIEALTAWTAAHPEASIHEREKIAGTLMVAGATVEINEHGAFIDPFDGHETELTVYETDCRASARLRVGADGEVLAQIPDSLDDDMEATALLTECDQLVNLPPGIDISWVENLPTR